MFKKMTPLTIWISSIRSWFPWRRYAVYLYQKNTDNSITTIKFNHTSHYLLYSHARLHFWRVFCWHIEPPSIAYVPMFAIYHLPLDSLSLQSVHPHGTMRTVLNNQPNVHQPFVYSMAKEIPILFQKLVVMRNYLLIWMTTYLFKPSKFKIPISPKKSPAFIVVSTLPVSLRTSKMPSAMINISRATSPFRHIESPGVKMYAFIFSTKSCKNSGWHSWKIVT